MIFLNQINTFNELFSHRYCKDINGAVEFSFLKRSSIELLPGKNGGNHFI